MTWTMQVIHGGQTFPVPSWNESLVLGYDMLFAGGLQGEYPRDGINADHLVNDAIIVALWDGVEYPDSRWWIQGGEGVANRDEGTSFQVVAKSLKDVFRRVIVRHHSKPWKPRVYEDKKTGAILDNLLQSAQNRGALLNLTWDFTETHDSAGNPWADNIDELELPAGQPFADVLTSMIENGYAEFRFDKSVIQAFNFGAMGYDKTSTIELRAGQDYVETPYRWSSEELVGYSLALGDGRAYKETTRAGTPVGPFGRFEQALSFGGTKKTSVLSKVNDAALERLSQVRQEFTRKLIITPNRPVPVVNYSLGDYILDRVGATPQSLRVRSFSISPGADGSMGSGSLSLNDQFLEREIRLAKKLQNISSPAGGVINAPPSVFVPDDSIPNIPTNVQITSGPYASAPGFVQPTINSVMHVSWSAPTTNTDTTDIEDIKDYEVRYRRVGEIDYRTVSSSFLYVDIRNLLPGESYEVEVRCWDKYGNSSDWTSPILSGPLIGDEAAPNQPSAPFAESRLGAGYVTWDGKDILGQQMPADFKEVRVHVNTVSGATPTSASIKATISSINGGTVPLWGLIYDETYYVRLVAVDYSLNESPVSDEATFVMRPIVRTELDVVLPGSSAFSDAGNMVIDGSFEESSLNDARLALSSGDWSVSSSSPFHGSNAFRVGGSGTLALQTGSNTQVSVLSVTQGAKIYFSWQVKRTTASSGTARLSVDWLNAAGGLISTSSAIVSSAPNSLTWTAEESVLEAPGGSSYARISIIVASNAPGQYWFFDSIQVRSVIGTALIQDAAITNAKIADVSANKITAGEIQAGQYIAAGPKLGTHAELASDGIRSYWLDPDTGALVEIIRLGTSQSDILAIQNSNGDIVASIAEEGEATFTGLQVTSDDKGFFVYGMSWDDWMFRFPRGILAKARLTTQPPSSNGAEVAQLEFRCVLSPGRNQHLVLPTHYVNSDSTNNQLLVRRVRFATGGNAVSTSSPEMVFNRFLIDTLTPFHIPGFDVEVDVSSLTGDTEYRFLLTVQNETDNNTMNFPYYPSSPTTIYLEDKGPFVEETSAITQRTSIWRGTHMQVYDGNNVSRMSESTWNNYSEKPLVAGDCAGAGNSWSIFGFQGLAFSGETTKTLAQALSGATIVKAELRIESQMTENEGSGRLRLRPHSRTAPYQVSGAVIPTGAYVESTKWRTGDAKWINITSIWSAANTGVVLDPGPDASSTWHNHIRSPLHSNTGDRPQLRVTYRR